MSNNDNAMTRFLFAILRQKNLKDIDWNKVARDPILSQEISNGHAARMRYSRFRAAMLGIEPQRRNKPVDKSRVTKPKKDLKIRKEGNQNLKPPQDMTANANGSPGVPKIKREGAPSVFNRHASQAPIPAPSMPVPPPPHSAPPHMMPPRGFDPTPQVDMLHAPDSFAEFPPPPNFHHDHTAWHQGPMFPPFEAPPPYGMNGFGMPCEHQHMHSHPEGLHVTPTHAMAAHCLGDPTMNEQRMGEHEMMGHGVEQVPVKHEQWESYCG